MGQYDSCKIVLHESTITGMGVELLPNWLVEDDFKSWALVNIFPGYEVAVTEFDIAAWLVSPSRSYIPLKLNVFINFIQQAITQ